MEAFVQLIYYVNFQKISQKKSYLLENCPFNAMILGCQKRKFLKVLIFATNILQKYKKTIMIQS